MPLKRGSVAEVLVVGQFVPIRTPELSVTRPYVTVEQKICFFLRQIID
jgi:hypothetical protein